MNQTNPTQLHTINELAEILRVPPKTIYQWVHKTQIPHLKVGRHLRFHLVHVLQYFENKSRRVKPNWPCREMHLPLQLPGSNRSLTIESKTLSPTKEIR